MGGRIRFALERFDSPRHRSHVAQLFSLGIMATRTSIIWTVILVVAQLVVIGELVATRVTPLARQFTGWSVYAAVFTLISIPFLLIASPFFWRSHRRLAISGLCVAVGAILISTFHTW